MDEKQKPVCGLCQRHQKLETVDGMALCAVLPHLRAEM